MALNKKDFADRMAKKGKMTKKEAKRNVELFLDTLIDCLNEGEVVRFRRFGRFEVKQIKDKLAQNPHTLEKMIIPAHDKVKFYASEILSEVMKR